MAEEDLLFGKNRHLFGGIQPSNMLVFTARPKYEKASEKASVILNYSLPKDTVIDGQTLCSVAGAVIRKSDTAFPETEFDGEKFADVKQDGTMTDNNVTVGKTYYYAAFPYSRQGVYNRNNLNRASVTAKKYNFLYGYDYTPTNSATTQGTAIKYPSDVDNAKFTPFQMNLTSGVPNYGGWLNSPLFDMFRPVMLKSNGTVDYELDHTDQSKKKGGGDSEISDTSYDGNAMVGIKKMYCKRWTGEDGVQHFRVCDMKIEEGYECDAHIGWDGQEKDEIFVNAFDCSSISSKIRSLKGQTIAKSMAGAAEITQAKENGNNWYLDDWSDSSLIGDLLFLIGQSTDVQKVFGYGYYTGGSQNAPNYLATGGASDKGMFYGKSVARDYVKVFYIENFYAHTWKRKAGMVTNAQTQICVKLSPPYDDTGVGAGYTNTEVKPTGTSGGYISKTKYDRNGRIPSEVSGSETTYIPDGCWFAASCFLFFGGDCTNGFHCGLAVAVNSPLSHASWLISPSLSYK